MKKQIANQPDLKPNIGGLYRPKGTKNLYVSVNYKKKRIRIRTSREDTPESRKELVDFLNKVDEKIKRGTFCFAKAFYWADEATKTYFTLLEGRDPSCQPEELTFGEFAAEFIQNIIPKFTSVTKRRDYLDALNSRILPHFGEMPFTAITPSAVEDFIDNQTRTNGQKGKPLSVKRVKNILIPMSVIWVRACKDHNWQLVNPFAHLEQKYKELETKALEEQMKEDLVAGVDTEANPRQVFLLANWQKLLSCVDPHYHLVMELLLMGMIGSELEGLLKTHVAEDQIKIRHAVASGKGIRVFKAVPKNHHRLRDIPITSKLRRLIDQAVAVSNATGTVDFDNVSLPENRFVLTMLDGSPFSYASFRKNVWYKAVEKAELSHVVPYAGRHTFTEWSLLMGVEKSRVVAMMGHATREMVDKVYGKYRKGLVEEKQAILDYVGEDFLALEELREKFPERFRRRLQNNLMNDATVPIPFWLDTGSATANQSAWV